MFGYHSLRDSVVCKITHVNIFHGGRQDFFPFIIPSKYGYDISWISAIFITYLYHFSNKDMIHKYMWITSLLKNGINM